MIYNIDYTSKFKKQYKKMKLQGKNIPLLINIINKLKNGEILETKYSNHLLANSNYFKNCYECHIEPDWLLIYRIDNENLILLLCQTGSHSELFK